MRIFLVRHGQTTANIDGVFCGKSDVPLTLEGIYQAQQVAAALKNITFQSIHCSEMTRACQTAQIISPSSILSLPKIYSDYRLNELDFGAWELSHYEEIAQKEPQAWAHWLEDWQNGCPTEGEPFRQFAERVEEYMDRLHFASGLRNHLIVAHQGVLGLLLTKLLNLPVSSMWSFPFRQGTYSIVDNHNGFNTLRTFNAQERYWPEK
ncbi:adenosylcobalamin/alpha-ribazole phosphatase [Xenorhabdus szentirmaii]|uniref:Alpha-ribazole phosphatase n=1 Tax=Xenorhabdus szentirmaii DSM 16338 TaxID=1427518 RepID=W1J1J7_9GAMM|nr:adenosylcobalamin/alpha-ribazole phosphatase [Xenorhabdus szentirmaii]PHM30867.1 phosphoglycerate mutase [Xenorhabdus szentirmaii DSM 16338]PHM40388.1 phosphoglycerate mutase [Xenorhabdus szentirmaii]CDL83751.1 Alpha-ribazole phosphatase [Xenorhabdus szentirmaii DSM 16338]